MLRLLDKTLGRFTRHFIFIVVRCYYALFYNVSVSGKALLQQQPGTLILATHVSRHDGPFITTMLYSTARIRPTVHYNEYYHKGQWFPMWVSGAIPMSSPSDWPEEKRNERTAWVFEVIGKVLGNGNSILMFPAGKIRRQPEEVVARNLTGVREILRRHPDTPVMLLRLGGLGQFQTKTYDLFWSFLGIKKGRRHVSLDLTPITDLDPNQDLETFNAYLEELLNS